MHQLFCVKVQLSLGRHFSYSTIPYLYNSNRLIDTLLTRLLIHYYQLVSAVSFLLKKD